MSEEIKLQTEPSVENKQGYEEIELGRVTLNFEELEAWRNTEADDIPICSFLSLYKACGLEPILEKYFEENNQKQIVALDNLACNFNTLNRCKQLIEDNWACYSINIEKDNSVFWDTKKWGKNEKHYAKKLSAKIQHSLNLDCIQYCPGIDEELENNVIVFRIYQKPEENTETIENKE